MQRCTDDVYLHVFDEVMTDILEDDRKRDRNVHKRRERRWLGYLKIPFATIYANQKVEGTFRVRTNIKKNKKKKRRLWWWWGAAASRRNRGRGGGLKRVEGNSWKARPFVPTHFF